mmetsp:Transcript_31742/g.49679  ORF Transcript_31742/g.49679 Transcript_31742/m.49679 type:complete len:89 (-) Transcript_31742:2-268(-)
MSGPGKRQREQARCKNRRTQLKELYEGLDRVTPVVDNFKIPRAGLPSGRDQVKLLEDVVTIVRGAVQKGKGEKEQGDKSEPQTLNPKP